MTTPTPDELRALMAKATPGPWAQNESGIDAEGVGQIVVCNYWADIIHGRKNAALIVAAVNALPGLLDELARLTGENERLRGALSGIVNYESHKSAEFDVEFECLQATREGCDECAHAQRRNWPRSGMCNEHYTPWSRLMDTRQRAVECDDKWGRVDIARQALASLAANPQGATK